MKPAPFLYLLLLVVAGCRPDRSAREAFEINARLDGEPDRLHPMLSQVGYATDVLRLTHFPLLEFHPQTLEMEPLLAVSLPEVIRPDTGRFAGGQGFRYRIRPEAQWDDGTPVTAVDYLFTLKAVFNPLVKANAWRGYLSFIAEVETDPGDPRQFTVWTPDAYFLALPATGNFNVYPQHLYDPDGLMDDFSLADLRDPARADSLAAADPRMAAFAEAFTSDAFSRDTALVSGAGPYRLTGWETGQEIVLERKREWWGDRVPEAGEQFTALPTRIRFKIIPDEQAALTLLKDGGLDVMGGVTPVLYRSLEDDSLAHRRLTTYQPVFMQYVFIGLNNRNPKLEDVRVRKALAHLMDADEVIRTVLLGLGERITGPFHPAKSYYNHDLKPVAFNPEKARDLLEEAGWTDTNRNGIVDKKVEGKSTEMELTLLLSTGSEVGEQIGLLFQQQARQAGVSLKLETRDLKINMADIARRDYDMALLRLRQSPADDDPYQSWHSDSDRPDGSNRFSYRNAKADSLILAIRNEPDGSRRKVLYRELHRRIYEDQPVIFLYAPKEPVLARQEVKGIQPSPMRPGYYLPFLHF